VSSTSQLKAHLAVVHLDAVLDANVRSYHRTLDVLIDEFHEQADARRYTSGYSRDVHRAERATLFRRYRAAVLAVADVLADMRADVGVAPDELPAGDADTLAALDRLRRQAERHRPSEAST